MIRHSKPPLVARRTPTVARHRRTDTIVLALALGILVLGVWLGRPQSRDPVGRDAPELLLPIVANGDGEVALRADPEQVTVLQFFASWCGQCRQSLPRLEASQVVKQVRFLSVSVDDNPALGAAAARSWGLERPVLHDRDGVLSRFFQVSVLPTTAILDADGRVAAVFLGRFTEADLGAALARARD